jgi:hypothetical protein
VHSCPFLCAAIEKCAFIQARGRALFTPLVAYSQRYTINTIEFPTGQAVRETGTRSVGARYYVSREYPGDGPMSPNSGRNYGADDLPREAAAYALNDLIIDGIRVPRSLNPKLAHETRVAGAFSPARTRIVGVMACLVLATSAAAAIAPTLAGKLPYQLPSRTMTAADDTRAAPTAAGVPSAQGADTRATSFHLRGRLFAQAVNMRASSSAPVANTFARLDREEIAIFISLAEKFLKAGDIAPARLLLRRAAEAGDARAALALGVTYDPRMLQPLRGGGIMPDAAMARAWYEKAKEFGSTEARALINFWASD